MHNKNEKQKNKEKKREKDVNFSFESLCYFLINVACLIIKIIIRM